jgi:hypothetical protein
VQQRDPSGFRKSNAAALLSMSNQCKTRSIILWSTLWGQDRADAEKGLFLDLALRGAWVGWVSTNDNSSPTTES